MRRTFWNVVILAMVGLPLGCTTSGDNDSVGDGPPGASPCTDGYSDCGGVCVDLQGDGFHCGTCGSACADAKVCSSGSCQESCTVPGRTRCGTSCVDLPTNPSHCGACDVVCETGQACESGVCTDTTNTGGTGGSFSAEVVIEEGELGQCEVDGVVESTNAGFTGAGYLNTDNVAGASIEWALNIGEGGTYSLEFAYANALEERQADVLINGTQAPVGVAFASTSSWTTWSTAQTQVMLTPGENRIVLRATASSGLANIDRLTVTGAAVSASDCDGSVNAGGGTGGGGTGGSGTGGTGGSEGKVFSECRFHFGTIRDFAIDNAEIREQIDFFTPGWMGLSNTFDQQYVCDDVNGVLAGKVPVVVAYVSAFYAKNQGLNDCNVGTPDLCTYGAEIIKDNLEAITNIYRSYAQGYANCLDPDQPIVFEMEPDWYQYTLSSQTDPMTPAEAGQVMNQYVGAMKEHLPSAHFSMDISPWVPPNNGSDHGATWYENFDMSLFTFINTSGGGTEADNDQIRSSNNMTWAGVSGVTNLPVLGDTGYGVNGASAGHDAVWDNPANINARIADGVIGISQYNPNSNWGSTIESIRGQLATPEFCP